MAMTSVKLLAVVLRKPDTWIGLWGVLRGKPLSHKLCTSWNRYSTKLRAPSYKRLIHNIFSLKFSGLLLSPKYIFPFSIRLKSNKRSNKSTTKSLQKVEDEEDSDEESDHDEMTEQEEELEDDPTIVKDYQDLEKAVQSFWYDDVLKTGLDIGRNKVEDAFYKGELRLNGEKLWKKNRTVKVGDTLDLLTGDLLNPMYLGDILDLLFGEDKEGGTKTVMRILLKKVFED
nr:mitochondrial transcription rescue factor 1-like [Pongo pygmaeus]XP_054398430.1 mitochondrial transcription rescue factor 1-like [Pongo abelii]